MLGLESWSVMEMFKSLPTLTALRPLPEPHYTTIGVFFVSSRLLITTVQATG